MIKISIIIVNYNTSGFIVPCIASIQKYAPKDTQVIVVDNASTDGSVEIIQKLKAKIQNDNSKLEIIQNKENFGYAQAVNQGIKAANGDYLFILNPDTKLTEDAIDELLKFTQNSKGEGLVGPKLLNPDGSIQNSCYHELTFKAAFKEYFLGIKGAFDKYAPPGNKPVKVDAVVGAAMLIPRSTIKKVGLFDERYFMYLEDLDYCRRIRNAGLSVYYLPISKVYHEHGGITSKFGEQAWQWLRESSKIYHGIVKYLLLTFILRVGQKLRKFI